MKSGKLYIDIETLPPLLWPEHERTAYVASKVPGQFKKPESIAAWCQENYEETWSRAALDWRISRIACIGVVWEPDDSDILRSACFVGGPTDEQELRMFTHLADFLREHKAWAAHVVGTTSSGSTFLACTSRPRASGMCLLDGSTSSARTIASA